MSIRIKNGIRDDTLQLRVSNGNDSIVFNTVRNLGNTTDNGQQVFSFDIISSDRSELDIFSSPKLSFDTGSFTFYLEGCGLWRVSASSITGVSIKEALKYEVVISYKKGTVVENKYEYIE